MDFVASPSVRRLAAARGLDLAALAARTGRRTLAREDVEAAAAGGAGPSGADPVGPDPALLGALTRLPLSRREQAAARALVAGHGPLPQVTQHDRADLGAVERLRADLAAEAGRRGIRITALALHVMALARCLAEFPRFNAVLEPGGGALLLRDEIHVGIAVDTAAGLVVAVLRQADRKGLWAIAAELGRLAQGAREGRLPSDAVGIPSMTISNLGAVAGTGFTPLVRPPELAILGVARAETAPVWDGAAFRPARIQPLALSYDHRAIDGAAAARFLARHARLVEDPRRLLL